MEKEEDDTGLSSEMERMVAQEDWALKPHQEETKVVDLGVGSERKEVKVGTGMTASIHNKLVTLLQDYQDVFTWSYRYMPSFDSNMVQHRLPLNPGCSPVKQKLRRIKPEMSLKIKEEVKKQFDV